MRAYTRFMRDITAAAAVISSSSSAFAEEPYYLSGKIDNVFVSDLEKALQAGNTKFEIKSQGGSEYWALLAANKIANVKDTEIIIDDICLSACAMYILPSATTVHSEGTDLIALHHSTYAVLRLNGLDENRIAPKLELENIFQLTVDFFEFVDGDPSVLDEALQNIDLQCIDYENETQRTRLRFNYNYWVPDRAALERLGISFSRSSSTTSDLFSSEFDKRFVRNFRGRKFLLARNNVKREVEIRECR